MQRTLSYTEGKARLNRISERQAQEHLRLLHLQRVEPRPYFAGRNGDHRRLRPHRELLDG